VNKIEQYLSALETVDELKKFRQAWVAATAKVAAITVDATFTINGVTVESRAAQIIERALASRARKGIAAQMQDAITDAETDAAALKAAAKAEYDAIFA
jgi:hypothetical protein